MRATWRPGLGLLALPHALPALAQTPGIPPAMTAPGMATSVIVTGAEARVAEPQRIEVDPPGAPHSYAAEAAAPMMRAPAPAPPMAAAAGEREAIVRVLTTLRLASDGAAGP